MLVLFYDLVEPDNDLRNQKRINTELFIDGKQKLYIHKGQIKEIDQTFRRESTDIGSDAKKSGNEN